jgi:hypothetical protein
MSRCLAERMGDGIRPIVDDQKPDKQLERDISYYLPETTSDVLLPLLVALAKPPEIRIKALEVPCCSF